MCVSTMQPAKTWNQAYQIGVSVRKSGFDSLEVGTSRIIMGNVHYPDGYCRTERALFDILKKDSNSYLKKVYLRKRGEDEILIMNKTGFQTVEPEVYNIGDNPYMSKNLDMIPNMETPKEKGWYDYFVQKYGAENVSVRGQDGFYQFERTYYAQNFEANSEEELIAVTRVVSIPKTEGVGIETKDWFYVSFNGTRFYWRFECSNSFLSETWIPRMGKYNLDYIHEIFTEMENKEKEIKMKQEILAFKLQDLENYINELFPKNSFVRGFKVSWSYQAKGYVSTVSFQDYAFGNPDFAYKANKVKTFAEYQNYESGRYKW